MHIVHLAPTATKTLGVRRWVDKPYTWLAKDSLTRHLKSVSHEEAVSFDASRTLRMMETTVDTTNSINKQAWTAAYKLLYWLAKHELMDFKAVFLYTCIIY